MTIGSLIAGDSRIRSMPMRLFRLFVVIVVTAFALISLMFLLMVRVTDPLLPRAMFGVLNTLLLLSERRGVSTAGIPGLDAGDRGRGSVHLLRPRLQEPAAEEHRLRGHQLRPRVSSAVFRRGDDRRDRTLQADAVKKRGAPAPPATDRETRDRLLQASEQLFATRGFKDVTVRDICPGGSRQRRGRELSLRRQAGSLSRSAAGRHRRDSRDERGWTPRRRRTSAGRTAPAVSVGLFCAASSIRNTRPSTASFSARSTTRRRRWTRSSSRRHDHGWSSSVPWLRS